jgi:integrase
MTFDERVRALEPLGFSERQTRFLVTVALHSGFCLRRQYTAFAGLKYGAGVRDFLDRLVARRLARRFDFRPDRGHVYHLHACAIYDAIGQNDNRNRRRTSAALIARKLMLLDYVLGEPTADWYATEQDKVELLTRRFGIPPTDLPRRVYCTRDPKARAEWTARYFIHKLPTFLTGEPATPSFVYLATDTTGQAFAQFLNDHVSLVNHLSAWRIVDVDPQHIPGLPACEAAFRRFAAGLRRPRAHDEAAMLRTYFTTRNLLERDQIAQLSVKDLQAFRAARARFVSMEVESLYRRWQIDGDAVIESRGVDALLAALGTGAGQAAALLRALPLLARTMAGLAMLSGLRRGELFALRWKDIDEGARTLTVREAVYDGAFSTPKTAAGVRQIPLSATALQLIADWRHNTNADPDRLVFLTRTGMPLSPNNVLRRAIFPACGRLGLPKATWLTFRRTYSSWSHDKGVPGKVVAQLMGHANVDTTLNVYTQVLDGSLRAAADKVGSELFTIVHKPEGNGVPTPRALAGPGGETRISHERA